jgi:hypothetical protein
MRSQGVADGVCANSCYSTPLLAVISFFDQKKQVMIEKKRKEKKDSFLHAVYLSYFCVLPMFCSQFRSVGPA